MKLTISMGNSKVWSAFLISFNVRNDEVLIKIDRIPRISIGKRHNFLFV